MLITRTQCAECKGFIAWTERKAIDGQHLGFRNKDFGLGKCCDPRLVFGSLGFLRRWQFEDEDEQENEDDSAAWHPSPLTVFKSSSSSRRTHPDAEEAHGLAVDGVHVGDGHGLHFTVIRHDGWGRGAGGPIPQVGGEFHGVDQAREGIVIPARKHGEPVRAARAVGDRDGGGPAARAEGAAVDDERSLR